MNIKNLSASFACILFTGIFAYIFILALFGLELLGIEESIFSLLYFVIFILAGLHCILLVADFIRRN